MAFGNKATGRVNDSISVLKPTNSAASNQVRFQNPDVKSGPKATQRSNQTRVQANTKGTDKLNLESAIALSGKRKTNIPLPANF